LSTSPTIPFPVDLGLLGPASVVASLNAAELGSLVLLARAAWTEDPPGSLPADDEHLARLCGRMDHAAWMDVRPVVLLCFVPGQDGRVHNAELAMEFARLAGRQRRLSQAGRAAAASRWSGPPSGCEPYAGRIRLASDSHPGAPLRAPNLTLSAQRSGAQTPHQMNPSAQGSEQSAPMRAAAPRSAGARAPEPAGPANPMLAQLRRTEQRIVRELLSAARWPWADHRHNQLPPGVIDRLVEHPHATVRQVEWALSWARELSTDADSQARGITPVRRVIGCIERPVLPPIFWVQQYEARQDRRDRELEQLRRRISATPAASKSGVAP